MRHEPKSIIQPLVRVSYSIPPRFGCKFPCSGFDIKFGGPLEWLSECQRHQKWKPEGLKCRTSKTKRQRQQLSYPLKLIMVQRQNKGKILKEGRSRAAFFDKGENVWFVENIIPSKFEENSRHILSNPSLNCPTVGKNITSFSNVFQVLNIRCEKNFGLMFFRAMDLLEFKL